MTDGQLHLVRLELDAARLFERVRGLPPRQLDTGYLVHSQLAALFADRAPKPFLVVEGRSRRVLIWGYTDCAKDGLRNQAQTYADPLVYASCDWNRLETKHLPIDRWQSGRRLGFEVHVCPTLRKAKAGSKHKAGSEVDVFLARCWEAGQGVPVDRERCYRDWLAERLAAGGAKLLEARMERFRLARLLRRKQDAERSAAVLERPDVLFRGILEVTDGAAFAALLARGVGRHRAFGFGMLLLRPPRRHQARDPT